MIRDIRFKNWPFAKGEKVRLYWIGSPRRNSEGNWKLPVWFHKEGEKLRYTEMPWGTLPLLRFGEYFADGKRLPDYPKEGKPVTLYLPDVSKGQICDGFSIPKSLYPLYHKRCGTEKCWRFISGSNVVYLPCIELVRSFFVPSKVMAHAILKPYGLEELILSNEQTETGIFLYLSDKFTGKIAGKPSTALHLAWVIYNDIANCCFKNVYRYIYESAIEKHHFNPPEGMKCPVPIEMYPPLEGSSRWRVRAVQFKNTILILEILSVSGFKLPFSEIKYSHHSIAGQEKVDLPKRKSCSQQKNTIKEELVLDQTIPGSGKNAGVITVEIPPTAFNFRHPIKVTQIKSKIYPSRTGVPALGSENYPALKTLLAHRTESQLITVSASETAAGSTVPSVEYKPIVAMNTEVPEGLEKFYLVVEEMKKINQDFNIIYEFGMLPQGRAYSRLENGKPRAFALVTIKYTGKVVYVLEVGRPDNRPLSTLIFWARYSDNNQNGLETYLLKILQRLIDNGGSWDVEWLGNSQRFSFSRLKHITANTLTEWAERILNKVIAV